jgi:AAA domain
MVTKSPKSPALCSRRSRVLVHPGSPEARKTNNYSLKESARTHTSENGKTGKKLSKKVLRRLKAADEAEVMELGREWRRAVREAKDPLPVDRALVLDGYWQQHAVAPVPSYSRFTTPASAARHGPVVWWLDGYEGTIVRGGVTVIGGLPKTGKTALACNIVAERSRQGKHILIWHSGEDSDAKWARRIERMGGKLAYVRFAADLMHLWAALEWESPDLVVIDPLQQFIGGGAKNDESTRNVMNELTREARRLDIPIIAVMHRKAHYHQGKLVGSEGRRAGGTDHPQRRAWAA